MSGMDRAERVRLLRRGSNVKRYHTESLINGETVGHHSCNVALLCFILTDRMCSRELLLHALTHDQAEQFIGDIPAPAKRASEGFANYLRDMEKFLTPEGLLPPYRLSCPEEYWTFKAADYLDLCYKCLEELEMGNSRMLHVLNNGLEYLSGLQLPSGPQAILNELMQEIYNARERQTSGGRPLQEGCDALPPLREDD